MKLRIRENTIRLRLKRSEVDQLAAGKSIAEKTHFPGSVLTYSLDVIDGGPVSASFDQGKLAVSLPMSDVQHWASTDEVSIVAEQSAGDAGALSLLIEKDFQCLAPGHHRPDEDDVDTFPHPQAASGDGCG